jgi:hypothetical protein
VEQPLPKKSLEKLKEERRRARWGAFFTPFITLASIVSAVGLLMFFLRACQDRLPFPLQQKPPVPLKNQSTAASPVPTIKNPQIWEKPSAETSLMR